MRDTIHPELVVTTPVDGLVTWAEQLWVRGMTEPGVVVSMEGTMPTVYINGSFEALAYLTIGTNTIIIRATDAANNTAIARIPVTRREREDMRPAEERAGMVAWAIGLLIGCAISIMIVWMVRRRRLDADAGIRRPKGTDLEGSSTPSSRDEVRVDEGRRRVQ
jgi:hypothetical protein